MKNKKFTSSDFDELEPRKGHELRFEKKLDKELHQETFGSKKWIITAAASVILLIAAGGFFLGQLNTPDVNQTANDLEGDSEEFPLNDAEQFYENSFEMQFSQIAASYKDPESQQMIEESLELIKDLQTEYKELEKDLKTTGDQRVATAMILNYKSRITILEELLKQLEYVNHLKNQTDEKNNA